MEKFNFKKFRITSLQPWFITGLAQGEATFTYSRSLQNISIYFSIRLRYDEKEILEKLYDYFRVGKIYYAKGREPGIRSGETQPSLFYRVSKVSELERVVAHFDRYKLIGKKYKAYLVWRDLVFLKKNVGKPDFNRLNELALKLSALNTKNKFLKNIKTYG